MWGHPPGGGGEAAGNVTLPQRASRGTAVSSRELVCPRGTAGCQVSRAGGQGKTSSVGVSQFPRVWETQRSLRMSQKYRPHKTFCSLSSCSAVDGGVGEDRRAVAGGREDTRHPLGTRVLGPGKGVSVLGFSSLRADHHLPCPEPARPSSERPVMPRGAPTRVFGLTPRGPPVSDGSAVGLRAICPVIVMLGGVHVRADVSSSGLLRSPHVIASSDTPVTTPLPRSCLGFRRPRHASLVQSHQFFGPGRRRSPQLCGFPSTVNSEGRRDNSSLTRALLSPRHTQLLPPSAPAAEPLNVPGVPL